MRELIHRPKKSLGQNFLFDDNIARKIVAHLNVTDHDSVLEIGAGHGMLTKYLVPLARQIVAVEIDRRLGQELRTKFSGSRNFQLIEGDILKLELKDLFDDKSNWKVVGNIPYHITSSIIFKMFDVRKYVHSLTLMIQKEVAIRIAAGPNSKNYGILSVLSQLYADVESLFPVSKNVFFPKPKVESMVIRWRFLAEPRYDVEDELFFRQMIKALFGQRRKVIRNSLKKMNVDSDQLDFSLTKRPEQLSVAELVHLSNLVLHGKERY